MLATINVDEQHMDAAEEVMKKFAESAQRGTLGDYSELGALHYVLEALNVSIVGAR